MSETTSQDPGLSRSRAEITLKVTSAILLCLAALLGNVLVVYVINKYSEMQTITNIFIQNLALTDILMATLTMPLWVASLYTGTWNMSHEWCEVTAIVQVTMAFASVLNMGLIALNRYIKVVRRALYSKFFPSKRVAWLYCGVVWLLSVILATPPLYGWGKLEFDSDFFACTFDWKEGHFSYVLVIMGGFFNVLTSVIFYCYWKIYRKVKESVDNVNASLALNGVGAPTPRHADIKVLKSCFTVVCVFLFTWAFPSITTILTAAGDYAPPEASKVAPYFVYSSCLVNPIIYGIMNPQFKDVFKKVFRCGSYGNDNSDQSHARSFNLDQSRVAVIIHPRSNETR
ncbi:visual pigment-like receptor peropsin [Stylophora pistillata]|uniref:visual pigment-like receptor peropsin n=1 Tax=Stylophora pistillata TaxID=50429 RepID=UPI000C05504D|nr:visual pigment-like receptor peropsin [Stylophora pistillata]